MNGIWGNNWGGQCFEDLMRVTDALEQRADIDKEKMIAMGGSFGGYMTNWIGTQTTRFRCLVNHAGLTDFQGFHGVTDGPAWWSHMFETNPYTEREALTKYSPLHHISSWETPVLIIHGERDFRVPVGEALVLFEALDFHGVDTEMLIFPDENHWILKPRNITAWYDEVFSYIRRKCDITA